MLTQEIIQNENGFKKVQEYQPKTSKGLKAQILEDLENSTVEVNSLVFDSDELAQNRILRALYIMDYRSELSVLWKLADNTVADVPKEDLIEVLALSGEQQSQMWFNS